MSKYDELWRYVSAVDGDVLCLTFDEIGKITGFEPDHSFLAFKKELTPFGWKVGPISMKDRTIGFERVMRDVFYTSDRLVWRKWLCDNFRTSKGIWFVFPMKGSGQQGLSYNDAVEEALCFGWIDSTAGKLDENHCLRHFTPRRKGSSYSRANIERLIWLDGKNMLIPEVRKEVLALITEPYVFPSDIIDRIRADESAWKNYLLFSESYRRIRVAYIDSARQRPKEFEKRLENFIAKTRENRKIVGYGGIDKYY